jgi:hypothetical protein
MAQRAERNEVAKFSFWRLVGRPLLMLVVRLQHCKAAACYWSRQLIIMGGRACLVAAAAPSACARLL